MKYQILIKRLLSYVDLLVKLPTTWSSELPMVMILKARLQKLVIGTLTSRVNTWNINTLYGQTMHFLMKDNFDNGWPGRSIKSYPLGRLSHPLHKQKFGYNTSELYPLLVLILIVYL